jgi:hypothetical protein
MNLAGTGKLRDKALGYKAEGEMRIGGGIKQPAAGPWVTDRPAPNSNEDVLVDLGLGEYVVSYGAEALRKYPGCPWASIYPPVKP